MEFLTNHNIKQTNDFILSNLFKCIEIICIEDIDLNKDNYLNILNFLKEIKNTCNFDNFYLKLLSDIILIKSQEC